MLEAVTYRQCAGSDECLVTRPQLDEKLRIICFVIEVLTEIQMHLIKKKQRND